MSITNKKAFTFGTILAVSFFGVLALIFAPIFGDGKNGLVYSDDMFNKLSKGSSYFIPKVAKSNEEFLGKSFLLTFRLEKPEQTAAAVKALRVAGAQVEHAQDELTVRGDLGKVLAAVLTDADAMFKNDGRPVAARYGMDEREAMASWWAVLKSMDKAFKKQKQIDEAKITSDVMKKAIEPAYNFYEIDALKIKDRLGKMTGLLVFYVIYTMWWGFAIFYLFEGIGLTMKKAKVKKEV